MHRRALLRSNILRATAPSSPLPLPHYRAISAYLTKAFSDGAYLKDGPSDGAEKPPMNPLGDPSQMEGMMAGMKTQMVCYSFVCLFVDTEIDDVHRS